MASDKALSWVFAEEFVEETSFLRKLARLPPIWVLILSQPELVPPFVFWLQPAAQKRFWRLGTGAGVSGLWLLQGMSPDGVLTTIDQEVEFHKHARRAFAAAGIPSQRTRLIAGRALDVLPRMAARGYDMMVIDAPNAEIPDYLVMRSAFCALVD